jgi:hypothetical protein
MAYASTRGSVPALRTPPFDADVSRSEDADEEKAAHDEVTRTHVPSWCVQA